MTGVHGLQHVQCFRSTRFADDDAVRAHTQGVDQKIALGDGTGAFNIHRPGFQTHDVALLQLQLSRVFNGDDTFFFRNEARHGVQHRSLAGAGAAGDNDVQTRFHAAAQKIEHAGSKRFVLDQIFRGEQLLAIAADGNYRADKRERRDDGAHSGAVFETGVNDG